MAKMTVKGLDAYMAKLSALEQSTDRVVREVIHDGAEIVADAIREGLESLPTSEHDGRPWWGTPGHPAYGPSREQKQGLLDSFGITPVSTDSKGFVNVHMGFDGYNSVKSARWPQGQPNQMVARAVESGTSFMEANPAIKRARARARKAAEKAMERTFERESKKIVK